MAHSTHLISFYTNTRLDSGNAAKELPIICYPACLVSPRISKRT